MDIGKIIDFVEGKRIQVSDRLLKALEEGVITQEKYHELVKLNEEISRTLGLSFIKGRKLIEDDLIEDLSELFQLKKKTSLDFQSAFLEMKKEIVKASKNPNITKVATTFGRIPSQLQNFPMEIPPIYQLYDYINQKIVPNISPLLDHCTLTSKSIFREIRRTTTFISDPPDDYYRPATLTLTIGGGDCDDFAILLCSLWRSIGFKTYVGFLENHAFPGLILAKTTAIDKDKVPPELVKANPNTEQFLQITRMKVPADPQFIRNLRVGSVFRTFDAFDLAFPQQFEEKCKDLFNALETIPEKERKNKSEKLVKAIQEIVNEFKQYLLAVTYEVDP